MNGKPENSPGEVHGNSEISVTVNYQEQTKSHEFGRGAKVSEVLLWALGAFSIDDTIATEMELAIEGTKDELPGSKTLASLAHGGPTLTLDLIRGDIANGAF